MNTLNKNCMVALWGVVMMAGAVLPASGILAQERTAGGSLQQEANWSTLRNLVDINAKKTEILEGGIKACTAKSALYGPGVTGADETGCVPIVATGPTIASASFGSVYGHSIQVEVDFLKNTARTLNPSQHSPEWKYNIQSAVKKGDIVIFMGSHLASGLKFSYGSTDSSVNFGVVQAPSEANNYKGILQITDNSFKEFRNSYHIEGTFTFMVIPSEK